MNALPVSSIDGRHLSGSPNPEGTSIRLTRPRPRVLAVLGLVLLAACGSSEDGGHDAALGPGEGSAHPMVGQTAPEFVGDTLTPGGWLPLRSLRERPVALLFFRPEAPSAVEVVREFSRLREDSAQAGILFTAIVPDSAENIRRFKELRGVTLPILRDPGSITRAFGIGPLPTVILLDSSHTVRFRLDGYMGRRFRSRMNATAKALRDLPLAGEAPAAVVEITYARYPRAPVFTAGDLDGRTVDLARLRGQVVVINFFDQDSSHCLRDLPRLVPVLKEFRPRGVTAIGVTSRNLGGALRQFLEEQDIDYPVILDPARDIFKRFDSTRTPDTIVIDGDGFIRFRERGDRPYRADVTRLQLRLALGDETPAAIAASLPVSRYLGDGTCASCHDREYRDWLVTPHSIAWNSLQKDDMWKEPECVGCHVTGKDQSGGFTDPEETPHMVDIQCEVCHGPGGGHPQGDGLDIEAMRTVCVSCHTGQFVLKFDLDEALALVAHQDHPDLDRLFEYSDRQRRHLDLVNARRLETFRSGVIYVGADACRDCHQSEYDQWNSTPHSAAYARLLRERHGTDPSCTSCHTTGAGLPGGFGSGTATGPMINVQCEVCHGPGQDHIDAPDDLKRETIYGITDQCSFCIIQGVCATCHDQENDPDFDITTALPLVQH